MPLLLLIALFLAFGLDSPRGLVPRDEVPLVMFEVVGGILGFGLIAIGLGSWIAWRVSVFGYMTTRIRRLHLAGGRLLIASSLAVYVWILFGLGWGGLVESNWGLRGWFVLGHLAIFAPFILLQFFLWCENFLVDRALHSGINPSQQLMIGRYLLLKARQALGLTLPVVLVFLIRHDVVARIWPEWTTKPISEPIDFAILGGAILCISPLFVRLAFPTHSLPNGPLRRRLEHLGQRVGFQFRDILVWDTDQGMVNACVTGVLPWFRYVLLTDALIDSLEPREIAAVFGHEIGHIAHRHLPFFGFFFLGSLGLITLAGLGASGIERWLIASTAMSGFLDSSWTELIETGLVLASVALFFGLSFGHLSRRFERQADVFGCSVVSCADGNCPPHQDPDDANDLDLSNRSISLPCPAGIRIFADALRHVARQNGLELRARSWRHGSIATRIAFLESLQNNPGEATRFQHHVRRLRLRWGILLVASMVLAMGSQVFSIFP